MKSRITEPLRLGWVKTKQALTATFLFIKVSDMLELGFIFLALFHKCII